MFLLDVIKEGLHVGFPCFAGFWRDEAEDLGFAVVSDEELPWFIADGNISVRCTYWVG